jgi:hypothetical protein
LASSVIREDPGSSRYFFFNGLCTDRRSKVILLKIAYSRQLSGFCSW